MAELNVHYAESTGDAYDSCQCNEDWKTGDIVVILSENVIGYVDTWPLALSVESGAFHQTKNPAFTLEYVIENIKPSRGSLHHLQDLAKKYGIKLLEAVEKFQ